MTAVNLNRAVRGPVTAVPIVAGKGVRLVADTQNNRWLVEADETVLWENSSGIYNSTDTAAISESLENFGYIRFEGYIHETSGIHIIATALPYNGSANISFTCLKADGNVAIYYDYLTYTSSSVIVSNHKHSWGNGGNFNAGTDGIVITKIVGINRISA